MSTSTATLEVKTPSSNNNSVAGGEGKKFYNPIKDRFKPGHRSIWSDVPDSQWNDWFWQQKNRVRTLDVLSKVIHITKDEIEAFEKSDALFHMSITPYYAALMDPDNPNCPIRLQSVPKMGELNFQVEDLEDPLAEEANMPVPGITHRYPDRVLFYTTHNCPVYCRHCTRKRKVSDPTSAAAKDQIEIGLDYIASHPEIRDVIVSGGDPLSLSNARLDYILSRLRSINHIEVIRLGTRNLVTLPQRIDDEFIYMLKQYHPVYMNTHFNHPNECTREAYETAVKLACNGFMLGNQMVLLKGVNDNPQTVKDLNHKLLMMHIKPYYIFQCDLSQGISHFRTPIETGINIIEHLRGHTSGFAVPHYVVDAPGGGGKIPVMPDYVVYKNGREWAFRNYQNKVFKYVEPDENDTK